MKRFIITVALLIALVGSVFATDWKLFGSYENNEVGQYSVYFDYDATESFENEDIKYVAWLQKNYKKVEVHWYNMDENWWCAKAAKHNCYSTLEVYTNYVVEDHVNKDGTVTEYICWR